MDATIDQQVAKDEALVPYAKRLRIGRSNFRLLSDIKYKESTLQLVYDVLRLTPFFKAFLVTADVKHKDTKKSNEMYYHPPLHVKGSFYSKEKQGELALCQGGPHVLHDQADEGTGSILGVPDVPTDESEKEISWNSIDEEGDDDEGKDGDGDGDGDNDDNGDDGEEGDGDNDDKDDDGKEASDEEEFIYPSLSTHAKEETRDDESFDPISKTPENSDDEGNGEENLGTNAGREEGYDEEEEEDKLYRDVNINQGRGIQTTQEVEDSHVTLTPANPDGMESIFEATLQMDAQTPTSVAHLPMSAPTLTSSTISTITTTQQAPIPPTTSPSTLLQDLPNFGLLFGFDNRLKTLEANFSEFMQTNQFVGAFDRLRDEAQVDNDEFLKTIYENMQKIIKEQLKKILIEKMEGNKSIHRSNEQRNLYKALVEAYESDKIILDIYRETVTLKRRHDDDADKDEEPFAGSDRGSKRRKEGKEHESASAPREKTTRSAGKSTQGSKSRQTSASESATAEEPMQTTFEMDELAHLEVDTLTLELLAGPTYELLKGSCKSLIELEYHLEEVYKATTNQLDWVNPEGQQYPHNLLKPLPLIPNSRGHHVIPFDHFINNDLEYLRGVEERFDFNVSFRMFTRSIVIQRCVEDLQLGVESYQKKLNLTNPDTYCFDLKRKEAYIAYSNPRGFIYQNKDKQNRLMRIDELHKFSDGTLTDVRTALDDLLKGIRMKYLPQSVLRKSDKDRAVAMIQANDKRLKTRRIMRSLERFVGGRLYEGDFRMLQRTI
nr:hypothetical protein [Tanacetum cinerariifolium]